VVAAVAVAMPGHLDLENHRIHHPEKLQEEVLDRQNHQAEKLLAAV